MKITSLFTLFFGALFLAGCASTEESASTTVPAASESPHGNGSRLLMDQYKSGEIPGYRD
jgi:PBP1b-binding outer membrane lipoprotein LpoB